MTIRLLLARVEGTLLTSGNAVSAGTEHAVRGLRNAGIELAITSGRPPRALRSLIERLGITVPVSACDGGLLVRPDLSLLEQHVLPDTRARAVIAILEHHGLDVWVYRGNAWLVRRPDAAHVVSEQAVVRFAPQPVDQWGGRMQEVVRITGLTDDAEALARCQAELHAHRAYVSVARSRPGRLDVTHPRANTGELVRRLSRRLGISRDAIAAIGHATADVLMFRECGLAIAMGQSAAAVQRQAHVIARSNDADGFAYAVQTWVLSVTPPGALAPAREQSS